MSVFCNSTFLNCILEEELQLFIGDWLMLRFENVAVLADEPVCVIQTAKQIEKFSRERKMDWKSNYLLKNVQRKGFSERNEELVLFELVF